jgi:FMNH2-dependent dimethyl sulfone monooxygenase
MAGSILSDGAHQSNLAERIAYSKPRGSDGKMRLGIFWPHSRTIFPSELLVARNPDTLKVDNHMHLAKAAEDVGIDCLLIADGYASMSDRASEIQFNDPSTHGLLSAVPLIMATERSGILSTIHTTFLHPVQIARFGSHLSSLSGGRWGWNIVAGRRLAEAQLFGYDDVLDHDLRYDMADECVRVVRDLWSHPKGLDHKGKLFRVKGRMRGPFPKEQPLLVSAASSGRGHAFAIEHCDYLFATVSGPQGICEIRDDLGKRAAEVGKPAPPVLITAIILVRDRPGEAEREYAEIVESLDPVVHGAVSVSHAQITQGGEMTDFPTLLGTAEEVAEKIMHLHDQTGVTGLMFRLPYWIPQEVLRLGAVFERLEQFGIWTNPAARQYSW